MVWLRSAMHEGVALLGKMEDGQSVPAKRGVRLL